MRVRERAALAEAGDRAADELGIVAPQAVDREAELGDRAGFQVLDEHVGLGEQLFQERLVLCLGQVEDDRFLAAVEPDEISALALRQRVIAAREIALGPFDLDDARAGIREAARAQWGRHRLIHRNNEQAFEGEGHQYDRGKPSTCSARYERTRLVEIGATE